MATTSGTQDRRQGDRSVVGSDEALRPSGVSTAEVRAARRAPAPRVTPNTSARRLRMLIGLGVLTLTQLLLTVLVGPGFIVGLLVSFLLLGGYVTGLRRNAVAQRQRRRRVVQRARAAHPAGSARRRPASRPAPQRSTRPADRVPGPRRAASRPAAAVGSEAPVLARAVNG